MIKRFMVTHRWLRWGSGLMALGVVLGAFGAHALKGTLTELSQSTFEVGVRYHFIHALGILLVGILVDRQPSPRLDLAAKLFVLGILLFSGSLYTLALLGVRWFGIITPFGGLAFIAGWVVFLSAFLPKRT